jgi:hypothetical protein
MMAAFRPPVISCEQGSDRPDAPARLSFAAHMPSGQKTLALSLNFRTRKPTAPSPEAENSFSCAIHIVYILAYMRERDDGGTGFPEAEGHE